MELHNTANNIRSIIGKGKLIKFLTCNEFNTLFSTVDNEIYKNLCYDLTDNLIKNIKCIEFLFKDIIIVNGQNKIYLNFRKLREQYILRNEIIKFIRCGLDYAFLLTKNNYLFCFGENKYGQLGLKEKKYFDWENLQKIENLKKIKDLQCGYYHSVLLDKFGKIYGTGYNNYGQLGLNDFIDRDIFTIIELPFKVMKITCSLNSTLILNESNELFGCGNNENYECGLTESKYCVFTKIVISCHIKNIYKSFGNYNVIISYKNEIFVTGMVNSIKYLKFTKLNNIIKEKKYIYPLLLKKELLIVYSDYEIYSEKKRCRFKKNLIKYLKESQLGDIILHL